MMAKQLGFFFDQNYCTGCKACQIACKDKNDLPIGVIWRRVAEWAGGSTVESDGVFQTTAFAYYTSIACNHCEDPICIKVCPTTAIHKGADGIVSIDDGLCVGCRLCEWACPYGAPQFDSAAESRPNATSVPTISPRARSRPVSALVRAAPSSSASCQSCEPSTGRSTTSPRCPIPRSPALRL